MSCPSFLTDSVSNKLELVGPLHPHHETLHHRRVGARVRLRLPLLFPLFLFLHRDHSLTMSDPLNITFSPVPASDLETAIAIEKASQ